MRRIERLQAGRTGQRLDWSRSVNRLERNMTAGWDPFSPGRLERSPGSQGEKASDFKASPGSPGSPIAKPAEVGAHQTASSTRTGTEMADTRPSVAHTSRRSVRTDWAVWTGRGTSKACDSPLSQGWRDCLDWSALDGWRERIRGCASVAQRRAIVVKWAEAAGGTVEDDTMALPVGLRPCLALAELKTQAMIARLRVEVRTMACAWCSNGALPDHKLCEHCRWLAGART